MKNFNVKECYIKLIEWTHNWFNTKGENSKAIIGMSGGKDSTITAKLLVDASNFRMIKRYWDPEFKTPENEIFRRLPILLDQ